MDAGIHPQPPNLQSVEEDAPMQVDVAAPPIDPTPPEAVAAVIARMAERKNFPVQLSLYKFLSYDANFNFRRLGIDLPI